MNILCKDKYLLVSVDNPEDPEAPANQRAGAHLSNFIYASKCFFLYFLHTKRIFLFLFKSLALTQNLR